MDLYVALFSFFVGLALLLYSSDKLVSALVGVSLNSVLSAFMLSVVFMGFDPENLSVGATASGKELWGIVWGSIIGSAMVAAALAFGITLMLCPIRFTKVPKRIVALPILSLLFLAVLSSDGWISRVDGVLLLFAFF